MVKLYVTYAVNSNQAKNFSIVEGDDWGAARQTVFGTIGREFAFIYDENEFAGQVEAYGLTEIPLTAQVRM